MEELLELAIEAATKRIQQLRKLRIGTGCLLCAKFPHSCEGCPARNAKQISCREYVRAIDKIQMRLDSQIELWRQELARKRR